MCAPRIRKAVCPKRARVSRVRYGTVGRHRAMAPAMFAGSSIAAQPRLFRQVSERIFFWPSKKNSKTELTVDQPESLKDHKHHKKNRFLCIDGLFYAKNIYLRSVY